MPPRAIGARRARGGGGGFRDARVELGGRGDGDREYDARSRREEEEEGGGRDTGTGMKRGSYATRLNRGYLRGKADARARAPRDRYTDDQNSPAISLAGKCRWTVIIVGMSRDLLICMRISPPGSRTRETRSPLSPALGPYMVEASLYSSPARARGREGVRVCARATARASKYTLYHCDIIPVSRVPGLL